MLNSILSKDSQAMTSINLFSHCKPLGTMIREIYALFKRIKPFDIKCDMAGILLSKVGQITIRLAFLAMYLLLKFNDANCSVSRFRAS